MCAPCIWPTAARTPTRIAGSIRKAVPEILDVDLTQISANAWLVQNVPYTRGELTLGAASADADCAACLRCAPGAAIFTMERITWIGDAPVTLVTQSHPPGYAITTAI